MYFFFANGNGAMLCTHRRRMEDLIEKVLPVRCLLRERFALKWLARHGPRPEHPLKPPPPTRGPFEVLFLFGEYLLCSRGSHLWYAPIPPLSNFNLRVTTSPFAGSLRGFSCMFASSASSSLS